MNAATLSAIPAGHVRVTRNSNRYLRSRNGAWYGAVANPADVRIVPETEAIRYINGEFVTAEWPDGHVEHFDCAVTPMRFSCYGPGCTTQENVVPEYRGKDIHGAEVHYPERRYQAAISRLGRVGYYRFEALTTPVNPAEPVVIRHGVCDGSRNDPLY